MKKISRSALLPYSSSAVFDLVNDVERYPEFLPWCGHSEVLEEGEGFMLASIEISKAGIKQSFTTLNTLIPSEKIEMKLKDGPFKTLNGVWLFKSLDEEACKIEFDIEFEIKTSVLNFAIGAIFEQIASTMVQSFCDRAKQVYS